ncbi:protein kinase domain-containing protein [Lignipirellula cremea]|uniref:Serine/threonine-protein kinase PknD n=1 Tax=Lignipirellula cremea TaxID=2528010 RepID=A0A518E1V7_9BACT|nr:protein kinase [Lignipirellula cremea]QDU98077.1 Serine/threonine-protein kinase PknD [Lignipirellula cremea]
MGSSQPETGNASGSLQATELFDIWRDRTQAGETVDLQTLCAPAPHLADEVRRLIDAWQELFRGLDFLPQAGSFGDFTTSRPERALPEVALETRLVRLEHLADGGLGMIYRAEDAHLRRHVAVKFMQAKCVDDPAARSQFLAEAEVTGRLEHPGVVPVYGVSEHPEHGPFYAMRLIRGPTLEEAIQRFHHPQSQRAAGDHAIALRELLTHFIAVCKTIAYAHNRGVLHCDIKPQNIILGRYGETFVADWGSARMIARGEEERSSGELTLAFGSLESPVGGSSQNTGTLPYMSPEQAAGDAVITRSSDLFSLGATLYVLLTGQTPYDTTVATLLRRQVIHGDYPSVRKRKPDVSHALAKICQKAMALNPAERYASALALADDLNRFLADEPVSCYREPFSRAAGRFVRRHHRAAQVALASLLAIGLLTAVFVGLQSRLARRESQARRAGMIARVELAADSLAYEMDRRLWALDAAARDPRLAAWLEPPEAGEEKQDEAADKHLSLQADSPLNAWLKTTAERYEEELPAYCWFVNAADGVGTQVARYPFLDDQGNRFSSLGQHYSSREYFHGQGANYAPQAGAAPAPLTAPSITRPFRGTHREYVVAFSVPIREGSSGKVLGVIGMAVELGQMTAVGRSFEEGTALAIVYADRLAGTPDDTSAVNQQGLILHHPALQKAIEQHEDPQTSSLLTPHLSPEEYEKITRMAPATAGERLLDGYHDVMGEYDPQYQGDWTVAAAQVVAPMQTRSRGPSGWTVLLQERP